MTDFTAQQIDAYLANGIKDRWYVVCPSNFLGSQAISLRRFGYKLAIWRDQTTGKVHCVEDHCPHRGAPLSAGLVLGDRLGCPYHGVEVNCKGVATRVPGNPGCKLEGSKSTKAFHAQEAFGAIFVYNHLNEVETPPPLQLPQYITSSEWSHFTCYLEWGNDYRYISDNVMDPMHGVFLHKQSHTMSEGANQAEFQIRDVENGFMFEKKGQRNVNFDWTELQDTGSTWWHRLEIPYPKTGGPGGNFTIIGMYVPIAPDLCGVMFWRCRKVQGLDRNIWRFLYKNRLEARHWAVVEQDRVAVELMELDASDREILYSHDMGIVRQRRYFKNIAAEQLAILQG